MHREGIGLLPNLVAFKINVDVAIFPETNEGGIGVVAHDEDAVLCEKLPLAWNAAEVTFAMETGLSEVEFKGDAMEIITIHNHE